MSQKIRGELTFSTMAADIAALLDALEITGKVTLAGIAVGGAIALQFAGQYPQRASAVIAGSPATGISVDRRAAALERVARIEALGMASVVEDAMLNGYPPELRGDGKRFAQFRARWLGNDPSSYATIWRMLAKADMLEMLGNIRCPALVIGGSLDRVRPPAIAREAVQAISGARYVEVNTGHYMAVQTPELIARCIDEFLESVNA
jgi:3-oxoadipate enol-lactonase